MRCLPVTVLLLTPAVMFSQARVVEDDGGARVIASATKVARLAADRTSFYAVIEGTGETSTDAAARAERKLQTVLEAARQSSARADLSPAVPYGVMPAPNYGGYPGQPSQNPFVARYVVRVQAMRNDQLMSLSAALVAAGATVSLPQFEAQAADSARRARFSEALAQARADAEALAAAMGMRLGALIEVSSSGGPGANFGNQFVSLGRPFDMSGSAPPPEVVVTSNVTVRYRLLPR